MWYVSRIFRYLKPYRQLAAISVLMILLVTLANLLAPWPLKVLIDNVLMDHPLPPLLNRLLGALTEDSFVLMICIVSAGLFITLLQNGFNMFHKYVNTRLNLQITLDFRSDLLQHAQRLSLSFHDKRRSGQLMHIMNNQTDAAARLVMTIPTLCQSLLMVLGAFWIVFFIDQELAVLSLIVVPLLYASVRYYARHIQKRLHQVKDMEGETLSMIHEALSMLRVILAFGREDHEIRRFRDQGERALHARVNLTLRQTVFALVLNMISATGLALVVGVGAAHILKGALTVGQLLVVMAYITSVYQSLGNISSTVGSLQDQLVSLQKAFELLDTEPEIRDSPGALVIHRARGRVTFAGVHFSYGSGINALTDISFDAQPGQMIAVTGPTGAGKTTLVNLIPRFHDPHRGSILIDGNDVGSLSLRSLRRQISIVGQETLLFAGSIADNIGYGRLNASARDIIDAAKAANAHDFIMRLPDQYETQVGERGAQLSGGERQRIAVARAFLKDAPILILDEPTASIDTRTEAVVLQALQYLMAGRTTVMIAHRLSTIRNADVILVLNHGRLAEQGTHEALFWNNGLYTQLYNSEPDPAQLATTNGTV